MRRIHLIRHAKSSRDPGFAADIDRPLNERGVKTCKFMAGFIYQAGCRFSNVYCSPALRARSTIEIISSSLPELDVKWQIDEDLYTFDSLILLNWLKSRDESMSELVIVGHNPALTDLTNRLSDHFINNVPACGYVQLAVDDNISWENLHQASFKLTSFLKPKKLGFC